MERAPKITVIFIVATGIFAVAAELYYRHAGNVQPPSEVINGTDFPSRPAADLSNLKFAGVALPSDAPVITSRVDGLIRETRVTLGQRVDAEDVLIELDTEDLSHQVDSVESQLAVAKAEKTSAQVAMRRSKQAYQRATSLKEFNSEEKLESLRAASESAEANLKSAQAHVAEIKAQLARQKELLGAKMVKAPLAGQVSEIYVRRGSRVIVGQPLVRIVVPEKLFVRFAISGDDSGRIKEGSMVRIMAEGLSKPIEVKVTHVAPDVDAALGYRVAEAALPAGLEGVAPGTRVYVEPVLASLTRER